MRIVRWLLACLALILTSAAAYAENSGTAAQTWANIEPGSGKSFRECANCPEMVVAPSGSFMMGSPSDGPEPLEGEGPQHRVTFAKPFAIGKFSVTFEEWDVCVANGGCRGYKPSDEGWGRGTRPVTNVSWDDAKAYVSWLTKKTGKTYRLPGEAEREYVTRAGTTTPFWWGSSISAGHVNYTGNYLFGRGKTVPVDSFKPNPWGLYQVHGNVSEWVEDCWHDSYKGAPQDGSAFTAGECKTRVLRGGSWKLDPRYLRAASRYQDFRVSRFYDYGFRVARTLP
ncbi:MAG: formylglycine-generating enzyme family protein [Rhodomicrobium sp.]